MELTLTLQHSRHPDELYKNGIQRSSFVPCIELLKERFEVTDLDSGTGPCPTPYVTRAPHVTHISRQITGVYRARSPMSTTIL